jgi:NAD(P)-dependent dehydrogenase (short-subunit alcohol dehydrogenase family)
MQTVLLTRLKGAFDYRLAEAFVREGYAVFAIGEKEIEGVTLLPADLKQAGEIVAGGAGKIDIYVELSDERGADDHFTVRDGLNETVIRALYEENVLRPMATLEAFIGLLDSGAGKRLCFITSAEASINEARGVDGYGYTLGKAAMSNFYQMISNKLTPAGYTFRVFDPMPGEAPPEAAAEGAFNYFVRRRGTEGENPLRDDEARLVFRDAFAREHAW